VPEEWAVRVMHPAPPVDTAPPAVDWRRDSISGLLIAAYVALSGSVLGLTWSATTPPLPIKQAVDGSQEPFRTQIAADGRFLLLGIAAGAICALVVLAMRQDGPGATLGLAVGGVLAAVVANQVAILAQHDGTVAVLHALHLRTGQGALDTVGMQVRAKAVLMAWPITAVTVHGLAALMRSRHR
jgi:hypothetical protein